MRFKRLSKKRRLTTWNEAYCRWINRREKTSNSAKISSYLSISHFLYDYLRFIKIKLNTLITQYISCYVIFCSIMFCYVVMYSAMLY